MTPEQRTQLQGLAEPLLEDMDLRWQVDALSDNLQRAYPGGVEPVDTGSRATSRCGWARARCCRDGSGDLDELESFLRSAPPPGELAEVDLDKVRRDLGDDAANSLDRRQLTSNSRTPD